MCVNVRYLSELLVHQILSATSDQREGDIQGEALDHNGLTRETDLLFAALSHRFRLSLTHHTVSFWSKRASRSGESYHIARVCKGLLGLLREEAAEHTRRGATRREQHCSENLRDVASSFYLS
jgi:hypothetical protein